MWMSVNGGVRPPRGHGRVAVQSPGGGRQAWTLGGGVAGQREQGSTPLRMGQLVISQPALPSAWSLRQVGNEPGVGLSPQEPQGADGH